MSKQSSILLVFTKAPQVGKVKTRLQPQYSQQQSLELHKRLIKHTLEQCTQSDAIDIKLYCMPDSQDAFLQACKNQYDISIDCQSGKNLGERMANAFRSALEKYQRVIIIGTDCPELNSDIIEQAFCALSEYEVVISPARDGGYVLLGMRSFYPGLFDGIEWGSDKVYHQTCEKITVDMINWKQLGLYRDIDRAEDLEYFPEIKNKIF